MKVLLLCFLTLGAIIVHQLRCAMAGVKQSRYETFIPEEAENGRCHEYENISSAEKQRTGILIVGTEWWPRSRDFSLTTIQKDLSKLLVSQGHNVYITVFDPSEQEIEDAENLGVRLIKSEQLPILSVLPNVEQLVLHNYSFPDLRKYTNITVVIGYANSEGAADAARSIQDSLFKNASFVLLVTYIPEDTDMKPSDVEDHEYDILKHANIASVVMSLGPAIYLHFENKFRDLDKKPMHIEFFPEFDGLLSKTMTTLPDIKEGPIEILMFDFSSTTALNCSNNLHHVAVAVGKVANYFSGDRRIKLKIRGLSDEVGQACKKALREIIGSDYVSIHPYPYSENILFKISKDFRQCHLLLFAPSGDPFGIISFLASAAGVPTLSTEHSGFSEFIKRDMKHHYNIVIVNELGVHVNALKATEKWQRKIIDVLKDPTVYDNFVMNAQKLKHDLKKSVMSGTIAKSRKMVSAILQKETEISRPKCIERRGNWNGENTEEHDRSKRSAVTKADNYKLCLTQNGSLQIDVTVENATPKVVEKVNDQLFKKIKTCEALPALQKYLHGLGIKCLYTLVNSLSIFVLVPHVQSLDTLWAYYKNNSLERLVQADIMNTEAYEKLDERGITFSVSIERWRYRRCRLELLYLNQDEHSQRKPAEVTLTNKTLIISIVIICLKWTLVVIINGFQTGRTDLITKLGNCAALERVPEEELSRGEDVAVKSLPVKILNVLMKSLLPFNITFRQTTEAKASRINELISAKKSLLSLMEELKEKLGSAKQDKQNFERKSTGGYLDDQERLSAFEHMCHEYSKKLQLKVQVYSTKLGEIQNKNMQLQQKIEQLGLDSSTPKYETNETEQQITEKIDSAKAQIEAQDVEIESLLDTIGETASGVQEMLLVREQECHKYERELARQAKNYISQRKPLLDIIDKAQLIQMVLVYATTIHVLSKSHEHTGKQVKDLHENLGLPCLKTPISSPVHNDTTTSFISEHKILPTDNVVVHIVVERHYGSTHPCHLFDY